MCFVDVFVCFFPLPLGLPEAESVVISMACRFVAGIRVRLPFSRGSSMESRRLHAPGSTPVYQPSPKHFPDSATPAVGVHTDGARGAAPPDNPSAPSGCCVLSVFFFLSVCCFCLLFCLFCSVFFGLLPAGKGKSRCLRVRWIGFSGVIVVPDVVSEIFPAENRASSFRFVSRQQDVEEAERDEHESGRDLFCDPGGFTLFRSAKNPQHPRTDAPDGRPDGRVLPFPGGRLFWGRLPGHGIGKKKISAACAPSRRTPRERDGVRRRRGVRISFGQSQNAQRGQPSLSLLAIIRRSPSPVNTLPREARRKRTERKMF